MIRRLDILRSSSSKSGFTLIETMVAASLAVMMIGIVAGLIAKLHGRVDLAKVSNSDEPWQERMAEQLQAEFYHCQSVAVEPDRISFNGFIACDRAKGYSIHEPADVLYKLNGSNPSILLRTEKRLLARIEESTNTSFVCTGVTRFELLSILDTDVPPGSLRIRVHFQNESSPNATAFDLLLFRHGVFQ